MAEGLSPPLAELEFHPSRSPGGELSSYQTVPQAPDVCRKLRSVPAVQWVKGKKEDSCYRADNLK